MDRNLVRETIARRVAAQLRDGDFVNLGIGLPTLVPGYLPAGVDVILESENGIVGAGPDPGAGDAREARAGTGQAAGARYVVNAGGQPAACRAGGAFIDSVTSFGLIRGGHMDATVLGALQVDQEGNLANWIIPGRMVPGMGGAMDLVVGARKVIVAMEHTQRGRPKILKRCTLPLTATGCVDLIVTELGVLAVTGGTLVLKEINPACTVDEVLAATGAEVVVADPLGNMLAPAPAPAPAPASAPAMETGYRSAR
ncbi:MAG: 3-oxoacid CoA-transferase subunit B [Dactylosporangium sp.]|nr:3-oxoacid CoA-transferase subunit B [Dactylosporangium sp.]NNJ60690.1 3-oxoacid CoA-transferase subunit B [Dactylosporangium sp.]